MKENKCCSQTLFPPWIESTTACLLYNHRARNFDVATQLLLMSFFPFMKVFCFIFFPLAWIFRSWKFIGKKGPNRCSEIYVNIVAWLKIKHFQLEISVAFQVKTFRAFEQKKTFSPIPLALNIFMPSLCSDLFFLLSTCFFSFSLHVNNSW